MNINIDLIETQIITKKINKSVENNDENTFICEYDLFNSLKSPTTIIDIWVGNIDSLNYLSIKDSNFDWLNARLKILQRITDENFGKLDGVIASSVTNDTEKINAQNELVRFFIESGH